MALSKIALAHLADSDESILTTGNRLEFDYASVAEAFPDVDPGIQPFGTTCLFLIRHPKRTSKGGIIIPDEARSTEHYNTQVAKVLAVGPLAFKQTDPNTGKLATWSEGEWFKVGDFVRLPRYGGDRFTVPYTHKGYEEDPRTGERHTKTFKDDLVVALFKAKDVLGLITGDPLRIKAYID